MISRNASNHERRLSLVIEAYKKNQFKSVQATAEFYKLSQITLQDHLYDTTMCINSQLKNRKLTSMMKESLVQ